MKSKIKPIETQYKGYRFRSRLEARWAVFFDALGIKWQYEPEGFDLGGAGRYLPDFWLPENQCFVEIKPGINSKKQRKIYAAGRMDGYRVAGWRGDIDMHFFSFDDYVDACHSNYECVGFNGHLYVGPYAIDECGGHGDDGHFNTCGSDNTHAGLCVFGQEVSNRQNAISAFCRQQIEKCDLFFAWLDSPDRHGTLVEIGYAKALGKEIWIGEPTDGHSCGYWNDSVLWFAEQMADKIAYANSAISAFQNMDAPLSVEEEKCSALSVQSDSFVSIFYGVPGDEDFSVTEFRHGKRHIVGGELTFASTGDLSALCVVPTGWARKNARNILRTAYNAAKSARFEYGETPKV